MTDFNREHLAGLDPALADVIADAERPMRLLGEKYGPKVFEPSDIEEAAVGLGAVEGVLYLLRPNNPRLLASFRSGYILPRLGKEVKLRQVGTNSPEAISEVAGWLANVHGQETSNEEISTRSWLVRTSIGPITSGLKRQGLVTSGKRLRLAFPTGSPLDNQPPIAPTLAFADVLAVNKGWQAAAIVAKRTLPKEGIVGTTT